MKQQLANLTEDNKAEIFEKIIDELWQKSGNGTVMANLTNLERPLIISQIIQDAIIGGGISTFFYNKANSLTAAGLAAFKQLGLTKVYDIFEAAIVAFPKQPIPDQIEYCRAILEALPDANSTDEKWIELTDKLSELKPYILEVNLEYVRQNLVI